MLPANGITLIVIRCFQLDLLRYRQYVLNHQWLTAEIVVTRLLDDSRFPHLESLPNQIPVFYNMAEYGSECSEHAQKCRMTAIWIREFRVFPYPNLEF